MKRLLRASLCVVMAGGVSMALWPLGQIAYARWNQHTLRAAWSAANHNSVGRTAGVAGEPQGSASSRTARVIHRSPSRDSNTSSRKRSNPIAPMPPTRIISSEIGLDAVVLQGVDEASLRRGPGHMTFTALPGQPGNCVIAAHRNIRLLFLPCG